MNTHQRPHQCMRGRPWQRAALCLLLLLPVAVHPTSHDDRTLPPPEPTLQQRAAIEFSQARVGSSPGDFVLRDRAGAPVRLSRYRGKPLLVNFVFTGCFHVCPTSTRALLRAVDGMRERFGAEQFNVISIGFNQPTDTPMAMKVFAMQNRVADPNWEFLSPRAEDVPALADAFGFRFQATPSGFDHTVQVSVVDADGVIRQQVYGESFTATALGEPIRAMLRGSLLQPQVSLADLIDRVRIICSVYDPETGEYRADYTLLLEIAGGLTFLLFMLGFALTEWRARRRARRRAAPGATLDAAAEH